MPKYCVEQKWATGCTSLNIANTWRAKTLSGTRLPSARLSCSRLRGCLLATLETHCNPYRGQVTSCVVDLQSVGKHFRRPVISKCLRARAYAGKCVHSVCPVPIALKLPQHCRTCHPLTATKSSSACLCHHPVQLVLSRLAKVPHVNHVRHGRHQRGQRARSLTLVDRFAFPKNGHSIAKVLLTFWISSCTSTFQVVLLYKITLKYL